MEDTSNAQQTLESLGALKYKTLQALAKNRGIKANLSKAQLIQELLSASSALAQQQQQQTDSTETPADIEPGGDGDDDADVGGDADVDGDVVVGGDGVGDKRQRPQDGAIGDNGSGDGEDGGDDDGDDDGDSGADDNPQDRSHDKSHDDSEDRSQGDAQQPKGDSSTPQEDRNESMGVCDEPEVESFHPEDAINADQNDDSTSPADPEETEQQQQPKQQQQQQAQQQQQPKEQQQPEVQQVQQPTEEQQQPEEQQEQMGQEEQEQQVEPEVSERRRSERLVVANMLEKKSVKIAPRKIQSPKFVTKRPAACPSSRFDLAHQNMFALQPSIERYGKTPRKTPKKTPKKTDASKGKVSAVRQALFKAKTPSSKANTPAGNAPAGMPARPLEAVFGSGLKSVKRGLTVASKPCTLVVQRSNKKPTKVKEFRLSSNPSMREAFTFKPYSGPIRPITPALGALTDKSSAFNVGRSGESGQTSQKLSKKAVNTLEPVGIKAKLASGRAQAARRTAHLQSGKVHRENKLAEGRSGRD